MVRSQTIAHIKLRWQKILIMSTFFGHSAYQKRFSLWFFWVEYRVQQILFCLLYQPIAAHECHRKSKWCLKSKKKNVFKTINSKTNKQSAHVLNSKWTVRISWVSHSLSASSWIEINKLSRRNVETMRKFSIIADNGLVGSCGHTLIVPMRASTLYYLRWIVINCIELYSMRNEKKIIVIVLLTIKIWAQPSRWCLLLDFIAVYTDIQSGMLLNIYFFRVFLSTTTTATSLSSSS